MDNHTKEVKKIIAGLHEDTRILYKQASRAYIIPDFNQIELIKKEIKEKAKEIKELEEYLVWWEEISIIDEEEAKRKTEEQISLWRVHGISEQTIVY